MFLCVHMQYVRVFRDAYAYMCMHVCNVAQCYVVMLLKSVYALCLGICDFWNYKIYLILIDSIIN